MSKIVQNKIFSFIKEHKIVKTKDIERKFKLTQSSTRRYLIKLEESGLIERLFGEITLKENLNAFTDEDVNKKINSNIETKRKIAKHASVLSQNYKTIYIDSGSLCYYLLEFLDKNIEIFTNSISNANRAVELGFKKINILGGILKPETLSIVEFNKVELDKINFPISFLGVNAVDEQGNLYTPEKREAKAKNDIINKSLVNVILSEKEKFDSISTFKFSDTKKNIIIVTNAKQINFKNKNIQVINTK